MTVFLIVLSYLIGNISGSLILGKLLYGEDIREKGSGNAGTTNAVRVYGMSFGVKTFIIDFIKGLVVSLIALKVGGSMIFWMPLAVVLGHNFPILFHFKGGKGIATSFGCLLVLDPKFIVVLIVVFVILVFSTKYMSAGSVTVAVICLIYGIYLLSGHVLYRGLIFTVLAAMALIRHRGNIVRLAKGEEKKFR